MIIWRGKGILVVLIAFLGVLVTIPLTTALTSALGMPSEHSPRIGIPAAMLVATIGNFFFARYLGDPAKHRTLVDPKTGQTFIFKDNSSLMFIPVRFWTYIFAVLAVLALVMAIFAKVPGPRTTTPTRASAVQMPGLDAGRVTPRLRA